MGVSRCRSSSELGAKMRKYLTSVLLFLIVNDTYSQRDETCPRSYECVKRGECEFFKSEIQRSKQFTRGSDAWNDIILPLKSLICNQADKKICCKIQSENPGSPDSPDYLPGVSYTDAITSGNQNNQRKYP